MEDVMETCWIDSVTMCGRGYKCNECPKDKEHKLKNIGSILGGNETLIREHEPALNAKR